MIGVIADDLTGAAEIGAVGLRYGLRAEITRAEEMNDTCGLTCIDTDSRSCPPEEAGRRAAVAAAALAARGVKWTYKKVDSVLRGHVAAEIEAVMKQLGASRALLVPANPGLGRVIKNGQYLIRGKLIHETDFRSDPEYPRRSSSVRELLGDAGAVELHVRRFDEPLPLRGIVAGEVQTAEDLRQWASRQDGFTVVAGGAEFFGALLDRRLADGGTGSRKDEGSIQRPELFVCGSISESTRDFVRRSRQQGVPVFSLPEEIAREAEIAPAKCEEMAERICPALESEGRLILEVGWPRVSDARLARQIPELLSQFAAAVLLRARVGHVYAEGGATAASLVRRMGWTRLKVLRELAPGVVTLQTVGAQPCPLTLKPGSYAWPKEVLESLGLSKGERWKP